LKTKQKRLRVFELDISDSKKAVEYIKKNRVIFMEFFLLIKGEVSSEVTLLLDEYNICYKDISSCNLKSKTLGDIQERAFAQKSSNKSSEDKEEKKEEAKSKEEECESSLLTLYKPLRSGEELIADDGVVALSRINSGSKLIAKNSSTFFGVIDGFVSCEGEFIILKKIDKGSVIFNGFIVDKEILDGKLKLLRIKEGEIVVKDIE
jgi:septum site-determining protein MinC